MRSVQMQFQSSATKYLTTELSQLIAKASGLIKWVRPSMQNSLLIMSRHVFHMDDLQWTELHLIRLSWPLNRHRRRCPHQIHLLISMGSQVCLAHCIGGRLANQGVPHPVNLNVSRPCDQDYADFHKRWINSTLIQFAAMLITRYLRKVGGTNSREISVQPRRLSGSAA